MKVIKGNGYDIYIYKDDHAPPHCHVIFPNADEVVVTLRTLKPLYGGKLSKQIKKDIVDNIDFLITQWEILNK